MEKWVKIKSWHKIALITRASWYKTYCGRLVKDTDAEVAHDLLEGKSCESCLRNSTIREEDANRVSQ